MKHSDSAAAALLALAALLPGAGLAQTADVDGDGAADTVDECPSTAAGTLVDRKGCPAVIPPLPADEFPAPAAAPAEPQAPAMATAVQVTAPAPAAPAPVVQAPMVQAPAPTAAEPAPAPVQAPAPVVDNTPPFTPLPAPVAAAANTVPLPPGVSLLPATAPSQTPPPSPSLVPVAFDTGSAKLNGVSRKQLDAVLAALRAQPTLKLEIVGHTAAGEAAGLALARAQAVKTFLSDLGVTASRLKARGAAGGSAEVEFVAK